MPKNASESRSGINKGTPEPPQATSTDIAIIGAGIAGLHCGYRLKGKKEFLIAEASDHIGGKIWSSRYLENEELVPDGAFLREDQDGGYEGGYYYVDDKEKIHHSEKKLEFCAEFGPMRIELESQPILKYLIGTLNLDKYTQEFPPYQSPISEQDPQYKLSDEEAAQETPLDLLKLAVVRIIGRLHSGQKTAKPSISVPNNSQLSADALDEKLTEVIRELSRATATHQSEWKDILVKWLEELKEIDYQNFRQFARFNDGTDGGGTPLWDMGFWNVISEVLSHHAVMKLRDMGTFYHLIPENPNAAEWFIFWLRALKTSPRLIGIRGGMQRIPEELSKRIGHKLIRTNRNLIKISKSDNGQLKLTFQKGDEPGQEEIWLANHLVLTLPSGPLRDLAHLNSDTLYEEFPREIASVFGFPLLKCFFAVNERWWSEDATYANRYATLIPTRELHYWKSLLSHSKKGMVMVYTDRPATAFWSNYIKHNSELDTPDGVQLMPEEGPPEQNKRLIQRALKYLKGLGVQKKKGDVLFYGIRDWGRQPYQGAAHSWYPERKSWDFLKRFSAFPLGGHRRRDEDPNKPKVIHICGEAYSDYQAFMEGALRSSAHVLHTMFPDEFKDTPTPWLCDHPHTKPYDPSDEAPKPEKEARTP